MAKQNAGPNPVASSEINNEGFGVTSTIDMSKIDFRKGFAKGKWQNKEEFNIANSLLKREWQMRQHRNISSPWDIPLSAISSDVKGSSKTTSRKLEDYFIYCYKLWSMWSRYIQGKSNVKSPMTFSMIEATLAEWMDNSLGFTLSSPNPNNWGKVRLMQHIMDYERNKGEFEYAEASSIQECLIVGTSIEQHLYVKKEREIDAVLTSAEVMDRLTAKQKKVKDFNIDDYMMEDGKPLTDKIKVKDWDGLMKVHVPIFDFLVDPSAIRIQGGDRDATDCIRLMRPSKEAIVEELENSKDPFILRKNIEKIKSAKESYEDYNNQYGIYKLGPEFTDYDTTDTKAYYNKRTGKYILMVNDVIIRNGPLPYRHGQLPFTLHKWTNWPNKFYGVGMAIMLANTQAADEVLKNMEIEREKKRLSVNILAKGNDSEVLQKDFDPFASTNFIGLDDPGSVKELAVVESDGNAEVVRGGLKAEGQEITGVNSIFLGMSPSAKTPVRNNMMYEASTIKILKKGYKNYCQGIKEGYKQDISIIRQIYPEEKYEKVTGLDENGKSIYETSYKTIPIDNAQMGLDSQTGLLTEETAKGTTGFEVKPEYLSDMDDLIISLDFETLVPTSQAIRRQDIKQFMTDLIPLLTNPKIADLPGISELIQWYADEYDVPKNVTEKLRDPGNKEDIDNAKEQNVQMDQGISVPGYAGASTIHKYYHLTDIMTDVAVIQGVNGSTTLDQVKSVDEKKKNLQLKINHLKQDDTPKIAAEGAAIAAGQQAITPIQPGMDPMNPMANQMQNAGMTPGVGMQTLPVGAMMGAGSPPQGNVMNNNPGGMQ